MVVLATTTLRKGELLSRRWSDLRMDAAMPSISVPHTKTGRAKRVPLCDAAIEALRRLPSWGVDEYLFPSRPTARFPDPVRPYRWDIGDSFRKAASAANLPGLRVHDLRHVSTSVMTVLGVPEPVIRKVTGHRSRALERYQHLCAPRRSTGSPITSSELHK